MFKIHLLIISSKKTSPTIPSLYQCTSSVTWTTSISEILQHTGGNTSASAQEKGERVTDIPAAPLFVEASHPVARSCCSIHFLGTNVIQLKFYNCYFEHWTPICQQLRRRCTHSKIQNSVFVALVSIGSVTLLTQQLTEQDTDAESGNLSVI